MGIEEVWAAHQMSELMKSKGFWIAVIIFGPFIFLYKVYSDYSEEKEKTEQFYETEKTYLKNYNMEPNLENARELAYFYYKVDSFSDAINYSKKGLKIEPNSKWLNSIVGKSYYEFKEFDSAAVYLEREVQFNSECKEEFVWLGSSLVEINQPKKAIKYFEKLRRYIYLKKKDDIIVAKQKGNAYLLLKNKEKACDCFSEYKHDILGTQSEYNKYCTDKNKKKEIVSPH